MTLFADTAGERLDAFLARQPGNLSRSAAQRPQEDKARRRPLLLNFYMIHTNREKINPYFLE